MIGEPRRHLATPELEQVDPYFWNLVSETSSKDELSGQNAMGRSLNDPRLTIEMLPKSISLAHTGRGASSSGEPARKNPNRLQKTQTGIKHPGGKYLINGEYVERSYRKFG